MYGIYTGLVYVTPLIGGWIADRYLGMRMAAVIGGIVMMLGHFAMAVPSLLHVALGLLIVGNGFFKPNTTLDGRRAVRRRRRSAPRRRLHDLLHGHQPGRVLLAARLRHAGREAGLALRLRQRGRGHAHRPVSRCCRSRAGWAAPACGRASSRWPGTTRRRSRCGRSPASPFVYARAGHRRRPSARWPAVAKVVLVGGVADRRGRSGCRA